MGNIFYEIMVTCVNIWCSITNCWLWLINDQTFTTFLALIKLTPGLADTDDLQYINATNSGDQTHDLFIVRKHFIHKVYESVRSEK